MNRTDGRIWWGIILIAGGILFLLQNVGLLPLSNFVWAVLFAIAGIAFLVNAFRSERSRWAVIPGMILVYLAGLMVVDQVFPGFSSNIGGPLFLAVIGISFLFIYLFNPLNWWAVIPAGIMITLGIIAVLSRFLPGMATGGILFLGMGVTFLVLYFLPTPTGRMRWPLIPGGVLLLMGLLFAISSTGLLAVLWPVALILAGLYLFVLRLPFGRS